MVHGAEIGLVMLDPLLTDPAMHRHHRLYAEALPQPAAGPPHRSGMTQPCGEPFARTTQEDSADRHDHIGERLPPPATFVVAWVLALLGVPAIGTDSSTPFTELALRWMLFMGAGWSVLGGSIAHTIFARQTARDIGWESNGFQYEVGYASLAMGLAGIYASTVDQSAAWVVSSIASGLFLLIAGINHVVDIVRKRNYAPGQTVILLSDFGIPISLFALLIATGTIF